MRGVNLNVTGVCQVKVEAYKEINGKLALNDEVLAIACQHFLGKTVHEIQQTLLKTMEGHQRQILGTMTVEELYRDRAAFAQRVRDHVCEDLLKMGFTLVSYTVSDISDSAGYMDALGATQTSLVKREAAEGQARNQAEAMKAVSQYETDAARMQAEYVRQSHVSINTQKEAEAASDKDLNLKRAQYEAQVNKSRAEAEAAYGIEMAKQQQLKVREETRQKIEESTILLQVQELEAAREQKASEGKSLAVLIQEKNKAAGYEATAKAEAQRVAMLGEAEAAAIRAKGEAEAEVLRKRADAFKEFGQAALIQSIVDRLPEIATAMAAPLAKTEKMVFVSSDGASGSKLTGDVATMLASLPAAVEGVTGVNIVKGLAKYMGEAPMAPIPEKR